MLIPYYLAITLSFAQPTLPPFEGVELQENCNPFEGMELQEDFDPPNRGGPQRTNGGSTRYVESTD